MGTNSASEEPHLYADSKVWEVKIDRIESMKKKISATPQLLSTSAGSSNCCIFRVPQTLIDTNNHQSYRPHIVSIGPFHRGAQHLRMIEEHKWRFLRELLNRTKSKGLVLEDYLKAVQPLEARARECYSETICLRSDEFIEMLVLDGCFIIELFRKIGRVVPLEQDDPLISMSWVYSFFLRDFIRLENQIPFFILRSLFDISRMPSDRGRTQPLQIQNFESAPTGDGEETSPSLAELTLEFFNNALQRPDAVIAKYKDLEAKHLLDFLRSSFIPSSLDQHEPRNRNSTYTNVIQCISKLRRAGIKLQTVEEDSFLVVKFRHGGVIEMPTIVIDDFMSCFMTNCVAFEQCHQSCSKHFTTYATLLDCLVNTGKDVWYLSDRNIVENYLGTDNEVAEFINSLGKDVSFDIETCYLSRLFGDVNEYYKNAWHVQWASFKYTYFRSPWSFISAFAASVLLFLSVVQTYYSILAYRPKRS